MEDAHIGQISLEGFEDDALFGVFDGHGGPEVARFAKKHFESVFTGFIKANNHDVTAALKSTYFELDKMLRDPARKREIRSMGKRGMSEMSEDEADEHTENEVEEESPAASGNRPAPRVLSMLANMHNSKLVTNAGATAVVLHVDLQKRLITVANAGDSRAVLCKGTTAVALTVDHKPDLPSELARIQAAGGMVFNGRVNGNINLTRAIGDLAYKSDMNFEQEKQVITCDPDIRVEALTSDCQFVVLACDGLWEGLNQQEVCDFIYPRLRRWRRIRRGLDEATAEPRHSDKPLSETSPSVDDSSHGHLEILRGGPGQTGLHTRISYIVGDLIEAAISPNVSQTGGTGGDNISCVVVDLNPDDVEVVPVEQKLLSNPPGNKPGCYIGRSTETTHVLLPSMGSTEEH
jgi:protein phosphatase 1G